jgi:hypothetical protein
MKKLIAFLSVAALSFALIVGASANERIIKLHNANPKGKPDGKEMKCVYCHNSEEGGIQKKKGQGLKKGEANYAKTVANPNCAPCHKK